MFLFIVKSNKLWFDHLYESDRGYVVAWGEVAYKITSVDSVIVKFDSEFVYTINEVRYIPYMGRKLISVREMECTGFIVALGNGV